MFTEHATILLVDEMQSEKTLTKSWLEMNGYDVLNAADMGDALEEISDFTASQRPLMILFNSASSLENGDWLLKSLREAIGDKNVPLVAWSTQSDCINAKQYDDFVTIENLEDLDFLIDTLYTDKQHLLPA